MQPDKKPTTSDIKTFEKKYGLQLPEDYIDYLLTHNGGSPEACLFTKNKELGYLILNEFYGLLTIDDQDDLAYNLGIFDGRIPKRCIAIGGDPGGNQYCLDVSNTASIGHIYFWDHEEEIHIEDETEISPNMYFLSNSFTNFKNSLIIDE
ncbi:SMI1/KNR4 family protein [Marivirga tractuosa]|uniref:SMI1/KNR4 family protein n=1 Tax=Marivirga tractuosa TaxID=1006 RepID=UPI0035CEDE4F